MHKMIKTTSVNAFVIALIWSYLGFCLIQTQQQQIFSTLKETYVVEPDQKSETKIPLDRLIHISPGQKIKVVFYNMRYTNGINYIELMVVMPDKREFIAESLTRTFTHENRYSITTYNLPPNMEVGCGYTIYSRLRTAYDYNIISRIAPSMSQTPRIPFCIVDK